MSPEALAAHQLQLDIFFTIIRVRSPQFCAAHTQNLLNQRGSYDVAAARAVNQAPPGKQAKDKTAATVPVSHPRALLPGKRIKCQPTSLPKGSASRPWPLQIHQLVHCKSLLSNEWELTYVPLKKPLQFPLSCLSWWSALSSQIHCPVLFGPCSCGNY